MAVVAIAVLAMGQATALAPDLREAAPAASAAADPTGATIVIDVRGALDGYTTKQVTLGRGGALTVVNNDTIVHSVTSVAVGTSGDPLFDVVVPAGQTRAIPAAATLGGGEYAFYCSFHPSMRGTLTVEGESDGEVPVEPDFEQPLVVPEVLTGSDIVIPMRKKDVRVMPHGPKTSMWTYGGSFPGPTIKRPTGHATRVTFVHDLPRQAGSMTVHQHGGHQSSADDGQPTKHLIAKGGRRTYTYPLRESGKPMPAAFNFYHDHRMDKTARNNWRGLQGMFLVTDPAEKKLGLPHGRFDVPLHFAERSFTAANGLTDPFPDGGGMHAWMTGPQAPPNDATVGKRVLVNGRFAPYLKVSPGRYRFRLLNASLFSAYDFALSDGSPFVQVGTGNALLPHPVVRQDLLLGPAQRADVVVDFTGKSGEDVVLSSIPRSDPGTGTGSRSAAIMQFRVRGHAHQKSRVPENLAPVPRIPEPKGIAKTWTFGLSESHHGSFWSINGKMFDAGRIDYRVRMGDTEQWRLRNVSDMTHYVHLHEEQWHTVSRNGERPPPWERGLEDTWRLDPGDVVVVAARFTDFQGAFMVHCHMLDHEDHGMMAQFEVLPPRTGR